METGSSGDRRVGGCARTKSFKGLSREALRHKILVSVNGRELAGCGGLGAGVARRRGRWGPQGELERLLRGD